MVGAVCRYHAIAVEEEALPGHELCLILVVACARQHAKRHTSGPQFGDICVSPAVRRCMARVGVAELPPLGIEQRIETCYEHPRRIVGAEEVVDAGEHIGRGCARLGRSAEHGANRGHDEGGRYTFISDIADDKTDAAVLEGEEIIEVATNLVCGLIVRGKPPAGQRSKRKKRGGRRWPHFMPTPCVSARRLTRKLGSNSIRCCGSCGHGYVCALRGARIAFALSSIFDTCQEPQRGCGQISPRLRTAMLTSGQTICPWSRSKCCRP